MIETLAKLDEELFLFLNGLHTPFWDTVMYYVSERYTWVPFYLFLIFLVYKARKRESLLIIFCLIIAVSIADQVTSGFMKPFFMRFRPCQDPTIRDLVHIVNDHCGGRYGFASSHSSTTFALAASVFMFLRHHYRFIFLIFLWAATVAYSRVYLGVHYPGDIIVGGFLGVIIGILVYIGYKGAVKKFRKQE
ncbi:phosphatase PAP2 family protein [Roseivirga sp. BDSF3-8]|uniref:phosphatase PAP2 family protein n=1 Tax=Roseivirga sp. BDSF3-8 TaxID=3241598 RepID=UPI00353232E4